MKEVVIASACRTAIGAFGGSLRDTIAARIAAPVMKAAVQRAGVDPNLIDDIRFGCCMEPADSLNVTRVGALLAGLPEAVPAVTINRVCISGMEAVVSGMAMIQAEMADVVLAGGVEHMSGVAYQVPKARWGCRLQDQVLVDAMIRALHCGSHILPHPEDGPVDATQPPLSNFVGKPYIMGHTAEFLAQHLGISREEMDEVALRSHNNAERATIDGDFTDEIVPIAVASKGKKPDISFQQDEHFRPGLTGGSATPGPGVCTRHRAGHGGKLQRHQRRRRGHGHLISAKSGGTRHPATGQNQGRRQGRMPSFGDGAVTGSGRP